MPAPVDDVNFPDQAEPENTSTNAALSGLGGPTFDAVSFLNDSLPVLNISSAAQPGPKGSKFLQIQDASSQLQTLLNKVNGQHIKSSNQLTQITDDILRSGGRLAYEVEVLRGDANGLQELLTETLLDDIRRFVAEQVDLAIGEGAKEGKERDADDPEFIKQLRMLGQVKARLEAVIHIFGEAMKWTLSTSEMSVASSLISVSAPELGMIDTTDRDDIARKIAQQYRGEVSDLLDSDGGGYSGLEAAAGRVEELRLLCGVWKGTAEEKARAKFVDSLSKIVEDRKRALDVRTLPQRIRADSSTQRSSSMPGRQGGRSDRFAAPESTNASGGLFKNLQKLRDDLYLD